MSRLCNLTLALLAADLTLTAIGASTLALVRFDPESDAARWTFEPRHGG